MIVANIPRRTLDQMRHDIMVADEWERDILPHLEPLFRGEALPADVEDRLVAAFTTLDDLYREIPLDEAAYAELASRFERAVAAHQVLRMAREAFADGSTPELLADFQHYQRDFS